MYFSDGGHENVFLATFSLRSPWPTNIPDICLTQLTTLQNYLRTIHNKRNEIDDTIYSEIIGGPKIRVFYLKYGSIWCIMFLS